MVEFKKREDTIYQLKPEGAQIARDGSHEARFWAILPAAGIGTSPTDLEITKQLGKEVANFGRNQAIKLGWVKHDGSGYVRAVSILKSSTNLLLTDQVG
jgi:phenylalanyl-tRNA synthetase alpha chain